MVGGTIADLFRASERGPAMNLFSLINFLGQAGGGLTMGRVGQNLGFQWCYGVQGIAAAVSFIVNAAILRETRADKILSGRARKLTQLTGVQHACKADLQHKSFMSMLRVTAVRPLRAYAYSSMG
jgi:MFS family permease